LKVVLDGSFAVRGYVTKCMDEGNDIKIFTNVIIASNCYLRCLTPIVKQALKRELAKPVADDDQTVS
jgi:hypothetical protein